MTVNPIFPTTRLSFRQELKKRVDQYFAEQGIRPWGNWVLYAKTILISLSFAALYIWLVFYTPVTWGAIGLCMLLGANVAAIGFNIMHDGSHGSYSRLPWLNRLAAGTLDFIGASSFMWRTKHNVIHHTYTNIDGWDDDLDIRPWMRMTAGQKRYFFHRFQHFYFILLYGFLHVSWVAVMDFQKYFSGKIGPVELSQMTLADHLVFWGSKLCFLFVFVLIPILQTGLVPYMIGFLIFTFTVGIIISVVFQLAHTVEEVDFPLPADNNQMEDEWAIHQVRTTANFATRNRFVTWFVGGLNFQIEHHLFPKISHIHYPAISRIVKKTSEEFGLKYNEFKNVRSAVIAHILLLRRMGATA